MAACLKIRYGLIFALLCFCLNDSDAQCSYRNHFGPKCDFLCHCMNNEQCDRSTGNCPSGCDFDWVGPGCQRRNILSIYVRQDENQIVTRHDSNMPQRQIAALAVDRDLSTCSYTNYANKSQRIPWWRVWFRNTHLIRNISILTVKKNLDYFKNFKVSVENNTFENRYRSNHSGTKICYTHDNTAPRTTAFSVTCNRAIYDNQIKIRLPTKNTQLVLCDVRIYGECDDGKFGASCTERCSTHCSDICDKDYGTCTSCESPWMGTSCNQVCVDGKYGKDCKNNCSPFCKHSSESECNSTNGHCTNGCRDGYVGALCNLKCGKGKNGQNCMHPCRENCKYNTCSNVDGNCTDGCKAGYLGYRCEKNQEIKKSEVK